MQKRDNNLFNFLLILYIYLNSYLSLVKIALSDSIILVLQLSFFVLIFLLSLINNKWKIKRETVIFVIFSGILLLFNVIFADDFENVRLLSIRILISSLPPFYLITENLVSYRLLIKMWYKIGQINIVFLPYLYYLRREHIIQYIDIAEFTYLNCIILFYVFLMSDKKKLFSLLGLIPNFIFLLIAGSRMILIATVIVFVVILFFLNHTQTIKYYLMTFFSTALMSAVILNLESILVILSNFLYSHGINSRNINLFLQFIRGAKFEEISSGRDNIYSIVIEFIMQSYGVPHGIGKVYSLTNGQYYHSHNILLEMILTFGILASIIFILLFIYKFIYYFKYRKYNIFQFRFLVLISCPYLVRSVVGTYFLTDTLFLIMLSLMLTRITKEIPDEHLTNLIY